MRADGWTALLVGIAGVISGLAAVPATSYRVYVLVAAVILISAAVVIAARSRRSSEPGFTMIAPTLGQDIRDGLVVIGGTITDLGSDTLWIFEEGSIDGRRVWIFGGEALVNGDRWSFEYEPRMGRNEKSRRTLSAVRADRNCERQLRSINADDAGRRVVYDPAPGGCEVLGTISIFSRPRREHAGTPRI